MENVSIYLSYKLTSPNLVEELHEYKLKKLCDVRVFSLVLRTTSKDLPFPSLLLFKKINSEATDAVKCAQNAGKISENVCLWKYFAGDTIFQTCQFSKKLLQYAIAVRRQQRTQCSYYKEYCRENRQTSSWLSSWTFGFWWVIQSPTKSRLSLHENFKEDRTYCIISRLCKLFMSKLCNLRFFFWSNVEIWFTFSNSSRACFESLG